MSTNYNSDSSDNEKGADEIIKIMEGNDNFVTTNTDMMFNKFANPDKYIDNPIPYETNDNYSTIHDNESSRNYTETKSHNNYDSENKDSDSSSSSYKFASKSSNNTSTGGNSGNRNYSSQTNINMRKLELLSKLVTLMEKGVKLSKNYNMDSDIEEMEFEYQLHVNIKKKHSAVEIANNMLVSTCAAIELFNSNYDPFGADLTGWSESVAENKDNYYDVICELQEKYQSEGFSPEVKLLFLLSYSAASHVMLNSKLQDINLDKEMAKNDNIRNVYEQRDRDEALRRATEADLMRKYQKVRDNERNIEEMEAMMNNIHSDSYSDSSFKKSNTSRKMRGPVMPDFDNLNNNQNQHMQQQMQRFNQMQQMQNMQRMQQMQNMNYNQEDIRQLQILEQKRKFAEKLNNDTKTSDTPSHNGETIVDTNDDYDNIILNSIMSNDNESSSDSDVTIGSSNKRKRKR